MKRQPTKNKPGPKRITLVKALKEPEKKRAWKPMMIDQTIPEDPDEMLIAPVEKTKTSMCQMRYHVTDAIKF